MSAPTQATPDVTSTLTRLLEGPARPGQAFTLPGCSFGDLYRMARAIRSFLDSHPEDDRPICLGSDDRVIAAAGLLASLAGGPPLLIPHGLSAAALRELQRVTGFQRTLAAPDALLPDGVTNIDVTALTEEVETLASDEAPDLDRPWVVLATADAAGLPRCWSKTPGNVLGEVDYLIRRFTVSIGDRILSTVPPTHGYGMLYAILLPLVASARVAAGTPSQPEAIHKNMAEMSPTLFVGLPSHFQALKETPPQKGSLRLALAPIGPLDEADGSAFTQATGIDLVEIYASVETGGVATRCRAGGEEGWTPYDCLEWRVAGGSLEIRSPFLSRDLPIRDSGWFTLPDRVKPHGEEGFTIVEPLAQRHPADDEQDVSRRTPVDSHGAEEAATPHPPPAVDPRRGSREASLPLPSLTFEPAGVKVPLDPLAPLQAIAADHGIDIRADCGGVGICGKCRVWVQPGENLCDLSDAERDVLTPAQLADGSRLACQARAHAAATITIPDALAESAETRGKTGISGTYPVAPMTRRLTVAGRSPALTGGNTPQSLVDWLAAQVGEPTAARADIAALRRLARYRESLNAFTLVVHAETGIRRLLKTTRSTGLGFAVDLGTTSLAGYLCDLSSGTLLAADACVNPQRRFGEDVISRIGHINEKDAHLKQLQRLAVEGIDFLIQRCLEGVGADVDDIDEIALGGNTTMQQIIAGMHPYSLGVFPYFPLTLEMPVLDAGDIGFSVDPAVPVFLMPVVSGFVGGDTMAAILADRPHDRDETTLIVDIGTNGEVVLGNRKGLWVTSCATGPALEGAQISCGMRAVSGAIHRMWPVDKERGVAYEVLGNAGNRPMGICGSGIIDAMASLRRIGVILPNGRLNEQTDGVAVDDAGIGRHFTIADARQSATGQDIAVTLKDVRQIQLAKGALATGIDFLMRRAGIETIDRTILTGAFGARFDWRNALAIGMLPSVVADSQVMPKDNLAGVGVVMALLDRRLREEARDLCRRIRYLELAAEPDFAMAFAQATAFPEPAE